MSPHLEKRCQFRNGNERIEAFHTSAAIPTASLEGMTLPSPKVRRKRVDRDVGGYHDRIAERLFAIGNALSADPGERATESDRTVRHGRASYDHLRLKRLAPR